MKQMILLNVVQNTNVTRLYQVLLAILGRLLI